MSVRCFYRDFAFACACRGLLSLLTGLPPKPLRRLPCQNHSSGDAAKKSSPLRGINRRLAGLHNCFPGMFHPVKFLRCNVILFAPLCVLANSHFDQHLRESGFRACSRPYPATSESERSVSFNQLNRNTGHRIKYAKGDADTGTVDATAELLRTLLPMQKAERLALRVRLGIRRGRN